MSISKQIQDKADTLIESIHEMSEGMNKAQQSYFAVCIHRSSLEALETINEEAKEHTLHELDGIVNAMGVSLDMMSGQEDIL